jgi:flagellar basal-body rod protein FlgC
MEIFSAFEISAAGMNVERQRLDVSATNLANANTTRGPDGVMFKPLKLVTHASATFASLLDGYAGPATEVQTVDAAPRVVYEPGHPDADARGFVEYPAVNPVSEMIQLIAISRAYEANVRALNAAKAMAQKALDIGSDR